MKDTCWRESEDGNPTSKLSDEMFGVFLSLVSHLLYSLVLALVSFNTWPFCKMTINIRIEDIFLRYIDQPDDFKGPVDNEEFLYQSLKHLKYEGEMVDKIGSMEVLERKLRDLNRQKYEAQDKLRSYNPDMTKILSIPEAHLHQQFVMDAIRRIEKLKKAKLLEKEISPSKPHNVEIPIIEVKDSDLTTEESVNSKRNRNQSADDQKEETRLPTGPHLSISYLKTQKNWNLQNAEDITSSEGHMC